MALGAFFTVDDLTADLMSCNTRRQSGLGMGKNMHAGASAAFAHTKCTIVRGALQQLEGKLKGPRD